MAKFNAAQFAQDQLEQVMRDMAVEAQGTGIASQKAREYLFEKSGYSAVDGQQGQVYEFQIIPIAFINGEITACPHLTPEVHYKATPKPQSSGPTLLEKKSNISPVANDSSCLPQDVDGGKPIVSLSGPASGVSIIETSNTPTLLPPTL